ncbi:MAG: RHS repeat protein, partial [Coriobacteriia bacterium]|nr:RHS repeat protein [Coriobacteriia bacterium]
MSTLMRAVTKETGAVVEVIDYVYDDANRLLQETSSAHGETTYSYDARGNRVREYSDGQTRTHTYDLENRLEAV